MMSRLWRTFGEMETQGPRVSLGEAVEGGSVASRFYSPNFREGFFQETGLPVS